MDIANSGSPRITRRHSTFTVGLLAALSSCVLVSAAHAETEESAADVAAARSLAVDGLKLADAGQCGPAVDKLERAEKLHHAPIVMGRLGECYISVGRLVEGSELIRKMLREPQPAHPTPAMQKAYERAQGALEIAAPKIAVLTLSLLVKVPDAVITVDGQVVPPALLGAERPSDPGDHVVEGSAPGYLKVSKRVTLAAGERRSLSLELEVDPDAKARAEAKPAPKEDEGADNEKKPAGFEQSPSNGAASSTPASSHEASVDHTAAYVSWAIGAVGLGVGAGFGLVAMNDKSKLDKQCTNNVCPPDQQDHLDSAKRSGNISTIALGVGAAGAVLGTVLYFTVGGSSGSVTEDTAKHDGSRHVAADVKFRPRVGVGLGQVQLGGEF